MEFATIMRPPMAKTARPASRRPKSRALQARSARSGKPASTRYWSQRVTRESNALDLDKGVFNLRDPRKIAASLKRSAERSRRRKAPPYRSALSMLIFYMNRAGKNLPASRKRRLERAKGELKKLFGKDKRRPGARRLRDRAPARR
jgi:hypothetical protein